MPYYCTVPRCTSMAGKAKNVSFHQFPRDEELAKLWNKILKRGKPYTKYSKVCSLHFTPDDYTITSVGKNKGQWRTLRKDAIPSQNLPSESPTPYQRKQWSSWTRDQPSNYIDPTLHQQVAQAIYMQTMLALQAAGATETSTLNHSNGILPVSTEAFNHQAQTSTTPDTDFLKGKQTYTQSKSNSFKCTECSRCFKDPDVFILHKRSHEKNEKENFNLNLTLQANPILANLLKTNTENSNNIDNNLNVEMLMRMLAVNMEGYMRNFTSMIKREEVGHEDHDSDHSNRENSPLDQDRGHMDHDNDKLGHKSANLADDIGNLGPRGSYDQNNDIRGLNQDCQSTSSILTYSNFTNDTVNHNEPDINHDKGVISRDSIILNDRLIKYYKNNTYDSDRSVRYYENNDSGSQKDYRHVSNSDRDIIGHGQSSMDDESGDDDRLMTHKAMIDNSKSMQYYGMGVMVHESNVINRDRIIMDSDRNIIDDKCNGDNVTNDNASPGSSDESICDLNESIDSNKLVIDETV